MTVGVLENQDRLIGGGGGKLTPPLNPMFDVQISNDTSLESSKLCFT